MMVIGDDVKMENRCERESKFENRNSRRNCVIDVCTGKIDIDRLSIS
jgi:hypothetical protein